MKRTEAINLAVEPDLKERIKIAAEADRRSVSDWVRLAIERELERRAKRKTA